MMQKWQDNGIEFGHDEKYVELSHDEKYVELCRDEPYVELSRVEKYEEWCKNDGTELGRDEKYGELIRGEKYVEFSQLPGLVGRLKRSGVKSVLLAQASPFSEMMRQIIQLTST